MISLRSLVFTSLLDLDPAFGKLEDSIGTQVITDCVAWLGKHPEHDKDIHEGVRAFLLARDGVAFFNQLSERQTRRLR